MNIFRSLCAVWLMAALAFQNRGQVPENARIKDFQRPASDPSGRKSMLKGADAAHVGNGVFQITRPHLDTFKADGSPDIVIDAAECYFDSNKSKEVWSAKELSMRTGDQRISLQGVGFHWQLGESRLVVSNKVSALIRKSAISGSTNLADVRVTSDQMIYQPESVTFSGSVLVVDPQGEVRCKDLRVRFDANNKLQMIEALQDVILTQKRTEARGKRAVYTESNGLLRLSESTTWRMGDRHGSSELLILDRTNNTLRAETKVQMTIPAALLATNATPDKKAEVTISADTFDYAPTNAITRGPIAIYNGNVQAIDPQAKLKCELLTIFFDATNKLVRAIADRNVEISRPDSALLGPRALFEKDEITVDRPTWTLEDRTGSAQTLSFNPRTREIRAHRDVTMRIPFAGGTNVLLGSTAPAAGANFIIIRSDHFTNANNVATFAQKVRVTETRGQLDANLISLHFGASNRVDRIVADGEVIVTDDKAQVLGQRADYDLNTQQIRITGIPRAHAEGRRIIAREFLIDRNTQNIHYFPPFRIEIQRSSVATN